MEHGRTKVAGQVSLIGQDFSFKSYRIFQSLNGSREVFDMSALIAKG